jgi:hypothetical protein
MAWKQLMGSEVLNVSLSGGAAEAEGEGEETGAVLHIYAHCEGMPHYRSRAAAAAAGGASAGAQTTPAPPSSYSSLPQVTAAGCPSIIS